MHRTLSGLLPIAALFALDGTGNATASSATQVWTYNETTGKNELKPVNHVFINEDPAITYLELKNRDGSSEQIITTPEHPFYVQQGTRNTPSSTGFGPQLSSSAGHGDLGPNWVGAGHLKLGDQIRKFDGSSGTVVNVLTLAETRTMYNLSVEGNHNFFVGASSALVHNANPWCGREIWDHIRKGTVYEKNGKITDVTGVHDIHSIDNYLDSRLTLEIPSSYDPTKPIRATVRWDGGSKPTTLFPETWTNGDIASAMQSLINSSRTVMGSNVRQAFYLGVEVRGRVDTNGIITSFYPR